MLSYVRRWCTSVLTIVVYLSYLPGSAVAVAAAAVGCYASTTQRRYDRSFSALRSCVVLLGVSMARHRSREVALPREAINRDHCGP